MNKVSQLVSKLSEARKRVRREVIRDGKKVWIEEYEYTDELPDGYKRGPDGRRVKMSIHERRNRSQAAKKVAKSSKTKMKRERSMEKRDLLIGD